LFCRGCERRAESRTEIAGRDAGATANCYLDSTTIVTVVHRIPAFAPGFQATLQGADIRDAVFSEEQRHTGAGGFVWSSTVEDDLAIAGQAVVLFFQLLGVHAEGARNGFGVSLEIHRVAQVHDDEFFAGVELLFQFIDGDAGDAQITKKTLAGDKLLCDVGREGSENEDEEPAAERSKVLGDPVDLTAEDVAQAEKGDAPEKRSRGVERRKRRRRM